MAGFILGTSGGVLAAAAVYYTLSTDLKRQTAHLRDDLRNSSHLLSSSFDPQTPPPAASALVGPSYPREPRFSETLRSRWNLAVARAVDGVRTTDWAAATTALVDTGAGLVQKLGGEVQKDVRKVEGKLAEVGREVKHVGEEIVERVEAAKDGKTLPASTSVRGGLGEVGGNIREESLTGGPVALVKAKRTSEGAAGRLV